MVKTMTANQMNKIFIFSFQLIELIVRTSVCSRFQKLINFPFDPLEHL